MHAYIHTYIHSHSHTTNILTSNPCATLPFRPRSVQLKVIPPTRCQWIGAQKRQKRWTDLCLCGVRQLLVKRKLHVHTAVDCRLHCLEHHLRVVQVVHRTQILKLEAPDTAFPSLVRVPVLSSTVECTPTPMTPPLSAKQVDSDV